MLQDEYGCFWSLGHNQIIWSFTEAGVTPCPYGALALLVVLCYSLTYDEDTIQCVWFPVFLASSVTHSLCFGSIRSKLNHLSLRPVRRGR